MQRAICALMCLVLAAPLQAQELFSLFVPSDQEDVKRMLRLADLREGDVVFDLGSGDGRIVFEAARMHKGVKGRGIEIDEKLVRESSLVAQAPDLGGRVQILHQNVFDADLSEATVITMWLFPELMRLLRPKILAEARPGTRIIARTWDLGTWMPDETDNEGIAVHKWIVPARVEGYWTWDIGIGNATHTYSAVMEQRFQAAEGVVRVGIRRGIFDDVVLSGEYIAFTLTMSLEGVGSVRHRFEGRVSGDTIEGTVSVVHGAGKKPVELPWSAKRVPKSHYFAPAGLRIK